MPNRPAGKAGRRCDDASRRQYCRKNAFHGRYSSSCCAAPRRPSSNHPRVTSFNLPCFALIALAFIRTSTPPLIIVNNGHGGEYSALSARLILQREGRRLANASRPPSGMPGLKPRADAPELLVAVAPERRTRRGHGGRVCSHRERRDRDQ